MAPRHRSIAFGIVALTLVGSVVVAPAAPGGHASSAAGTVVFIHEQEPPTLRGGWVDNNLLATGLVTNNIWYGGQIYDSTATLRPRLFEAKPKIVRTRPQTISFEYKASAVWSDGKPVTCEDWKATWRVFVNPGFNVASRAGFEDIKSVTCSGKAGTIVFARPFAAWESLVSGGAYAAHVVRGRDMNRMFSDSIPVSSGPWKFQSWQRGVQLSLVKNPRFKAGPAMKLDRVVFRYILDTNARFQAMKAGEGHLMEPQPQLQIADIVNDRDFKVQRSPEYAFEHIDLQLGPRGHPALKLAYVRQALVTGINRPQLANALFSTIAPGLPKLDNLVFKPFEKGTYQPHFSKWVYNPSRVISILKGRGCTGGPDAPSATNTRDLLVPGRRQVGLPLLDDHRKSAAAADVRGHRAAAQERRHRAHPALSDGRNSLREHPTVGRLGLDDVHVRRRSRLEDNEQHALLVPGRPELRQLLQLQVDRRLRRGDEGVRRRQAPCAPEPRGRSARGGPAFDPSVHPPEVRHQHRPRLRTGSQHDE